MVFRRKPKPTIPQYRFVTNGHGEVQVQKWTVELGVFVMWRYYNNIGPKHTNLTEAERWLENHIKSNTWEAVHYRDV